MTQLQLINCIVYIYFNSHAHVERDLQAVAVIREQQNFNSHAHVERDGILYI